MTHVAIVIRVGVGVGVGTVFRAVAVDLSAGSKNGLARECR